MGSWSLFGSKHGNSKVEAASGGNVPGLPPSQVGCGGRLDRQGLASLETTCANGHLPFDKRCKTCITTAATGRAHRRVLAPSCYTLSLDVCGPFRKKGEYAGSKGYRYAMIGTYIMPKLEGYKDVPIPEEPNYAPELAHPEEDFLEEQGPQDPPLEPEDQAELDASNARFQALYREIGDGVDYQTLHYAIPLKSRLMPDVEAAVKQMYLQIRSEGLPVTRVHSDRARELRGGNLRAWLLHRDILPTTGEAQAPQTNGRAEAGVKRAKTRTKTLLRAAGLDTCCWPSAMAFAAFQQRECALGRARNVIAFGSPVLVKNKVFGVGNKFDLDDRWQGGIYVGPSPELRQGHMVRFPSGRVVTSLHIRSNAVDADGLVPLESVEASFPIPSRRITGKRPLAAHEGRVPADPPESSEVPLDHEDRSEHDVGHVEAAGVWTDADEEGPLVSFLGDIKYKRKCRLVLCGNFAAPEEEFGSLYAGSASAETFRTVLAVAAYRKWLGATADITGAFLLAPWPDHLRRYAVVPPRLFIDNKYISQDAYWLVRRPLYGLRESPAIWAVYRSKRLSQARVLYNQRYLVLKVSKVDPELWLIFFENEEELLGCIVTYVDDLFYVSLAESLR